MDDPQSSAAPGESETVKNIKAKMEEITNVITKVQDAIKKFGTKGWVGAMFTASK